MINLLTYFSFKISERKVKENCIIFLRQRTSLHDKISQIYFDPANVKSKSCQRVDIYGRRDAVHAIQMITDSIQSMQKSLT